MMQIVLPKRCNEKSKEIPSNVVLPRVLPTLYALVNYNKSVLKLLVMILNAILYSDKHKCSSLRYHIVRMVFPLQLHCVVSTLKTFFCKIIFDTTTTPTFMKSICCSTYVKDWFFSRTLTSDSFPSFIISRQTIALYNIASFPCYKGFLNFVLI